MDFLFFCSYDRSQDLEIVVVVIFEVSFSLAVCLSLFAKLIIIVGSQLFNSLPVTIVVIFEFVPESSILVDKSSDIGFSFLTSSLQPIVSFFNLVFFLFNLVVQSLDFGFM